MDPDRLFSPFKSKAAQEILKGLGYAADQNLLGQWLKRGFIKSSGTFDAGGVPKSGPGYRHRYEAVVICQIALFMKLNDKGLGRAQSSSLAFHPDTKQIFNTVLIHLGSPNKLARLMMADDYKKIVRSNMAPTEAPITLGVYTADDGNNAQVQYVDQTNQRELFGLMIGRDGIIVDLSEIAFRVSLQILSMTE